jgi:hypothetical protein
MEREFTADAIVGDSLRRGTYYAAAGLSLSVRGGRLGRDTLIVRGDPVTLLR